MRIDRRIAALEADLEQANKDGQLADVDRLERELASARRWASAMRAEIADLQAERKKETGLSPTETVVRDAIVASARNDRTDMLFDDVQVTRIATGLELRFLDGSRYEVTVTETRPAEVR